MNKVGDRYQIVIGRKVRQELRVKPGDLAVERVEDGRLVVDFIPAPHARSQFGIVKRLVDRPIEPVTNWDALRDRAWEARAREITNEMDAARRQAATRDPGASDR